MKKIKEKEKIIQIGDVIGTEDVMGGIISTI